MARTDRHYIPRPDGGFDAWAVNYYERVQTFWADHGLEKAEIDAVKDALAAWQEAYAAHTAAQAAAEAASQAKLRARGQLEALVRPMTAFLQSYPGTTDADRAAFGITVRSGRRTPAPVPASGPRLSVEPAGRLTHQLRLADAAAPVRRGKPRSTVGAEVWVCLVGPGAPAPLDPGSYRFLTLATRPTLRADFPTDAGGKTAAYMVRWVSTRGEVGPWSEVVTGTVAA